MLSLEALKLCWDTIRTIKWYKRTAVLQISGEPKIVEQNTTITFEELDTQHLAKHHDGTLLVTLDVANYEDLRIILN